MYPRSMIRAKIRKNITIFHLKIIIFTAVKNHCILHGHVFLMFWSGFKRSGFVFNVVVVVVVVVVVA